MNISRKKIIYTLLILGLPLGVWYCAATKTVYRTFPSRDGRFKVVFYAEPLFFAFPGGRSDAYISAKLIDSKGNVLEESEDRLCLAWEINDDTVAWLGDHVKLRKLLQWPLPPEK